MKRRPPGGGYTLGYGQTHAVRNALLTVMKRIQRAEYKVGCESEVNLQVTTIKMLSCPNRKQSQPQKQASPY